MWWISKNGHIEGPLPPEQVRRRINLNLIGSLDRVSQDRRNWVYLRDTELWNPVRTLPEEMEIPDEPPAKLTRNRHHAPHPQPAAEPPEHTPIAERYQLPDDLPPIQKRSKKTIIGVAVGFAALVIVALSVTVTLLLASRNGGGGKDANATSQSATTNGLEKTTGFSEVRDKLAIIKCKEGSGSGFLLGMDGKTYLVSNEHVFRSSGAPEAKLIDGTALSLGEFSVAEDCRDLARFEVVGCGNAPLRISEEMPNVGDPVVVYGNSLGGGVATESKGYIQGVGPQRLETNAEIVQGNSGSPLVNAKGEVVGVAAFLKYGGSGDEDWTIKNTRYDGGTRRFAVRLNDVRWKRIERVAYERQIANLQELNTFWDYLVPFLLFDSVKVDSNKLVYNDLDSRNFKKSSMGFDEMMKEVVKAYEKRGKSFERWLERCKGRKAYIARLFENKVDEDEGKKLVSEYDQKTVERFNKVKESYRNMVHVRKEAITLARQYLDDNKWEAPQVSKGYPDDNKGSVAWYVDVVRRATDLMNQKLKDLNKDLKELEEGDEDDN